MLGVSVSRDNSTHGPPYELDAETILRTLLEESVDFVVVGGFAVAAHGFPRATKDVDIVPAPEAENRRRLYRALRALGAEPVEVGEFRAAELPIQLSAEALDAGGNWALRTLAGRVDLMQWLPGAPEYAGLRSRALAVDVPRVGRIHVAGYDDLVRMKQNAGRPQDERDLEELRQVRGDGAS